MAKTFITIDLSRKQVDMEHVIHNDKTDKDYARIFAPGGGTFLYPLESLKVRHDDSSRIYFMRPEGTEIQVRYSTLKQDAPEDAPSSERYEHYSKTWKIEDLKQAYEAERALYAERNGFANITVPTSWGRHFTSDAGEFVSISIPIPNENNQGDTYYSFIVAADRFRDSQKQEGMSYFGFPKKKKDSDENYMVELRGSVKAGNEYQDIFMSVSSMELKDYVEKAVERSRIKEMFVTTQVPEKLVRAFESNEGKSLYAVLVPVQEDSFYEIIVPAERVSAIPDSTKMLLSLFRNKPDGTPYTFTGKHSVKNEDGEYDTLSLSMTSEQVAEYFQKSVERFADANNLGADISLAEEQAGTAQMQPAFHRNGR